MVSSLAFRHLLFTLLLLLTGLGCENVLAHSAPEREVEREVEPSGEAYPRQMSLIWYALPKRWPSHIKMEIDGEVYDGMRGFGHIASLRGAIRATRTGKGFWRYTIGLTEDEYQSVHEFLAANLDVPSRQNCVRSLCHLLHTQTHFRIPEPFTWTPLATAAYLGALSKVSQRRVRKVQYFGRSPCGDLLSLGPIFEVGIPIAALAYLYYTYGVFTN